MMPLDASTSVVLAAAPVQPARLTTGVFVPPSDWPQQVGIALLATALIPLVAWAAWSRIPGLKASEYLLLARWSPFPWKWKTVRAVALAADAPVAAVMLSQTAFDRGSHRLIETKSPVPVTTIVRARSDLFSA